MITRSDGVYVSEHPHAAGERVKVVRNNDESQVLTRSRLATLTSWVVGREGAIVTESSYDRNDHSWLVKVKDPEDNSINLWIHEDCLEFLDGAPPSDMEVQAAIASITANFKPTPAQPQQMVYTLHEGRDFLAVIEAGDLDRAKRLCNRYVEDYFGKSIEWRHEGSDAVGTYHDGPGERRNLYLNLTPVEREE